MSKNVTWEEFTEVVCEHLGMEENEISESTNIYEDIGIDSLGIMTLGLKLQRAFEVTIPLSSVSAITTLGGMKDILNEHIGKKYVAK